MSTYIVNVEIIVYMSFMDMQNMADTCKNSCDSSSYEASH
jgi:hypothetical protein